MILWTYNNILIKCSKATHVNNVREIESMGIEYYTFTTSMYCVVVNLKFSYEGIPYLVERVHIPNCHLM